MTAARLSQLHKRMLRWLAADHQRTQGRITSSHQELVRALHRDKGNISHSLGTLAARGWMIIGRSSGGKAESLRLTPEGQQWAAQVAGSGDEQKNLLKTIDESVCNRPGRTRSPLASGSSAKIASELRKRVRNVS